MNYVEIADYNWAEGSLMQRAGKWLKKGNATFALASQNTASSRSPSLYCGKTTMKSICVIIGNDST